MNPGDSNDFGFAILDFGLGIRAWGMGDSNDFGFAILDWGLGIGGRKKQRLKIKKQNYRAKIKYLAVN
ncbi:MAG: hypothetical protein ABIG61_02255 [Planctomycetota bacterium]